jgi:hypothetical protein
MRETRPIALKLQSQRNFFKKVDFTIVNCHLLASSHMSREPSQMHAVCVYLGSLFYLTHIVGRFPPLLQIAANQDPHISLQYQYLAVIGLLYFFLRYLSCCKLIFPPFSARRNLAPPTSILFDAHWIPACGIEGTVFWPFLDFLQCYNNYCTCYPLKCSQNNNPMSSDLDK